MKKIALIGALLCLTISIRAQDAAFGEWIELFNGKDLTGWQNAKPREGHHKGPNRWVVQDGTLTNAKDRQNDICTVQEFDDYELEVEYKIKAKGNSGVYLRGQIEVQIFDSYGKKKLTSADAGAIYGGNFVALENSQKAPGQWNKFRVLHVGDRITVWHNGVLIQDNIFQNKQTGSAMTTHPATAKPLKTNYGPIMLQGDHSAVWYQNIRIRPLFQSKDGWKKLWNGKDLSEFTARGNGKAKDGLLWAVEDHSFTNKTHGSKGHDIWTKEAFGNFLAYYSYRSDGSIEGGNSGFYLRDQWEIQIHGEQDTNGKHSDGSLYSIRSPSVHARHAGLRWNHVFVKLEGRRISVWQNGKRIHKDIVLDTRTDNHGAKTLDFSKAPFKLQGDHGKVWFSNLRIKPLRDDLE